MLHTHSLLRYIFILCILHLAVPSDIIQDEDSIDLSLNPTSTGIKLNITKGSFNKLSGTLGVSKDLTNISCVGQPICQFGNYTFNIVPVRDGFKIKWETEDTDSIFQDCFNFEEGVQWYGGPERKVQSWPIQKMKISSDEAYVLKQLDNFAVAEKYWLNSQGAYIYIDSKVPLYVDQNVKENNAVCFIAKIDGPYFARDRNFLEYHIIIKDNPKEAHLHAVNTFLGKPTGHPDEKMISEPIWTTWAKYKREIDDKTVLQFAKDIRANGYEKGQLEIDDEWETCYGAQEFAKSNFPDIVNTVKELKKLDFRVTLWIHPFVNSDCQNNSDIGVEKHYFVANTNKSINGSWWDGSDAHQIDFTLPEAAKWWSDRLKLLQESPGIDSFKFDAGETDYAPQPADYYNVDIEDVPNILSEKYLRTCAQFGPFIEVRSGSRTQDLPIFVRMIDKDSNWGDSNGLYTLITTLLQMNLNGYTLVLPDMVGGNGYNNISPDAELLVRWTQANTFMPAIQFSYLPWDVTKSDKFNASEIVQKYVKLHEQNSKSIIRAMEASIENGTPVNGPIWWIDPTDSVALACDDEYLLGEEVLVAPVIKEGATSRDVYLPKGSWYDANNGTTYQGPILLKDYPANISTLPYFFNKAVYEIDSEEDPMDLISLII